MTHTCYGVVYKNYSGAFECSVTCMYFKYIRRWQNTYYMYVTDIHVHVPQNPAITPPPPPPPPLCMLALGKSGEGAYSRVNVQIMYNNITCTMYVPEIALLYMYIICTCKTYTIKKEWTYSTSRGKCTRYSGRSTTP